MAQDDVVTIPGSRRSMLSVYFALTYLAILVLHSRCLAGVKFMGTITPLFAVSTYLVYSLLYLAPVIMTIRIFAWLVARWPLAPLLARLNLPAHAVVAVVGVLAASLLQVLLYADHFIFRLYGFHLNGFVWNLVFTRGGLDSLGGGESTTRSFALIILGFVLLQGILLAAAARLRVLQRVSGALGRRRLFVASSVMLLAVFGQLAYGVSYLRGYTPVLLASNTFPLYLPLSFNRLAASLGISAQRDSSIRADVGELRLRYPRKALHRDPSVKPLNIVWLVAESLRADMLDSEIMPNTHAFAQRSAWLRNHYSGGNGTRMGIFTMFYGLYGYYWFPFLTERRGPVFFDVLLDAGYQMDFYTGAGFSYPEFDRTVFVRIDPKLLFESIAVPIWKRDEQNVSDMLGFIDKRDPARPFMTYIFFESPHANYHFPKETALRRPFGESLNYATMDLEKDIDLIKNRYVNACHYLDTQIARVIDGLKTRGLLDSTIVLVTGDHGEEFMEKGRWGHNSAFTQEQIRTPAVLWVPGRPPTRIDAMTCHLDFPPTILRLLGVGNDPADYCQGLDLFGNQRHEYLVLADWNTLAYLDESHKVVIPCSAFGFAAQQISTRDDKEIRDAAAFYDQNRDRIVGIMRKLKEFSN